MYEVGAVGNRPFWGNQGKEAKSKTFFIAQNVLFS